MKFEHFIALRYLLSKKRLKFVSIISIISIIGVTIGVAALIVVLSVFNGFSGLVSSILISFDPHLRIEGVNKLDSLAQINLLETLSTINYIKGYSPFVSGKALVVSRNINRVVTIRGLELKNISRVSGLSDKIVLGSIDTTKNGQNGIVIGMVLADRLNAVIGDTIYVVSPIGAESAVLQLGFPIIKRFRVMGIYESNNKDYDGYYAFTDLKSAQSLFDTKGKVDGIEIRLDKIEKATLLRDMLKDKFGGSFRYLTWYDLHKGLYTIMQIERWVAYIILCLIIAVASFNLLGSLIMTVIEKRRDVGILKAMGAKNKSLSNIFTFQSLLVGIIGTIIGTALGLFIVYLQERYHLISLDTSIFIIPAMPVEVHITDILLIALTAIALCYFASRLPAKRAAMLDPVEAIRWE